MTISDLQQAREDIARLEKEENELRALAQTEVLSQVQLTRCDDIAAEKDKANRIIATEEFKERAAVKTFTRSAVSSPAVVQSNRGKPTKQDYTNSFKAWALSGQPHFRKEVKDSWRRSCDKYEFDPTNAAFTLTSFQRDAYEGQGTDTTADGYGNDLVNDSVFQGFVDAKKASGGIWTNTTISVVPTAEPRHYGLADDTSATAATIAQNADVDSTNIATDRATITPVIKATGVFPVSYQMLRDASIGVEQWLSRKLFTRILRTFNSVLTAKLVLAATEGATGYSNALTAGDLEDLYFSVEDDYALSPNACFQGNRYTVASLMNTLVANISGVPTGQPIWGQGLNAAPGSVMLGAPFIRNSALDTMVSGQAKKPILFGDFSEFHIHTVGASPTLVRADMAAVGKLSVGFLAYWEVDGALTDAGTHPVKYLATGGLSGD